MPKDNVDLTIEDVFGFSISEDKPNSVLSTPPPAATKPEEEEELDVDALLSGKPKKRSRRLSKDEMKKLLTGETPAPKPEKVSNTPSEPHTVLPPSEEPGTPLDAAKAVREAVIAHEGKRRSVDSWKDIARDVLQLGRLTTKRWENVLQVGVDAGLFRVDDTTLSYPHLVPLDPEPEVEDEEELEVGEPRKDLPTRPPSSPEEIKASNPPRILACGHIDFLRDPDHEKHVAARAEGKCCHFGSRGYRRHWESLREPYLSQVKVSEGQRKNWSKNGFQGYCADAEGRYIGGPFNDCRYHTEPDKPEITVYHPREEWCPACQAHYSE